MPSELNSRRALWALLLPLLFVPAAQAQPFQIVAQINGNTTLEPDNATLQLSVNAVGQSATMTITLTYTGNTSVILGQPQLFGQTNAFRLNTGSLSSGSLTQGQSASFSVTYTAASATQATGQLTVPYTEAGSTPTAPGTSGALAFALSGTAPNLVVAYTLPTNGNVVTITNGNTITFPSTVVGASTTVMMAIDNIGSGNGSVQNIMISGDAAFSLQSLPLLPLTMLAPNSGVTFGVVYFPSQTGTNTATLQITLPNQTITLGLQGTAVASLLTYQLQQGTQTSTVNPGATLTFPDTDVGDKSSLMVVVKNSSTTTVTGINAAVSGTGYSITDEPILPLSLNVNQTASFTITFMPTQAGPAIGRFRVGNDSFNLSGNAIGVQLTYSYTSGSATNTVIPGGAVLFPPEAVGQTESTTFTVQNTGTNTATITSIGIAGAAALTTPPTFTLQNPLQLPLSLAAGQSAQFSMSFTPQTTGATTATLTVNDQQFTISGFGNPPPAIPSYQFTGASGSQAAMSQVAVGLTLASAYSLPLSGKLTISVNTGNLPADPAVQFSTGGQTVAFMIPQGATQAVFGSGSSNQISLQTGTVAGTITITPSFALPSGLDVTPTSPAAVSISVPTGPVVLLNALVTQETPNSVVLSIAGYTTTRTLTTAKFQFTAQPTNTQTNPPGSVSLPNSTVTQNIEPYATAWFSSAQSQNFGGQFTLTVPFTITNQNSSSTSTSTSTTTTTNLLDLLQSVSITVSNATGSSNAVGVTFSQ